MNLIDIAKRRYATKKFDGNKRIPDEVFAQIKELLRFSPSSVNSQPWHFIIADNPQGKMRLAKGAEGAYAANHPKILNASHVILFCAKTQMEDDYLDKVTDQEARDGRFPNSESRAGVRKARAFYADLHRVTFNDTECWMQKQVYLNLGTILLGAGVLGVDAVPIEGVDMAVLNEEFALTEKGYSAQAVVALGYHTEDDFNASLPKSRLPEAEIFTLL
ncbi:oxygen-insensitive NAD(P)H nitroreductase [Thiomicrorhabdus sp.]|uniref:oxygen-insensitive NAD(P)H nitroreductase n=1 Tax=Thiomicrorhabdus sp. TaxID=2039724 RepID=UPI0029C6DFD9|nr:oxygen-insensitive NAD(P)H nitroreductase [Thiomicrorhabdus sp.]